MAGARFCTNCGKNISAEQALVTTARLPSDASFSATLEDEMLGALRQAVLGEYDLVGELGRGGMAIVYLAHDIALDRKVAIKVMSPALLSVPGMVERFKREARTSARLNHPHIIPIFTIKETERLLCFIMKYVPGRALDSIIEEEGALPIEMVRTILAQVAGALDHAHRHGVVHRDIKPANIMIDDEGWAVVTDFGIAKPSDAEELTATGMMVGTPAYMSPEQCSGKPVTGATDQYSLGVVGYEMLTGCKPFLSEHLMEIMKQHFFDRPSAITELRPGCPPQVAETVHRMLAKDAKERWPRLSDVVNAVGATPLEADDPIRTRMVELASSGKERLRLSQFSTPRSPIPTKDIPHEQNGDVPPSGGAHGLEHEPDTRAGPQPDAPVSSAGRPSEVRADIRLEEVSTVEAQGHRAPGESGWLQHVEPRGDKTRKRMLPGVAAAVAVLMAIGLVAIGIAVPQAPIVGRLSTLVRGTVDDEPRPQPEGAPDELGQRLGSGDSPQLQEPLSPADSGTATAYGEDNPQELETVPDSQVRQAPTTSAPVVQRPSTGVLVLDNLPPGGTAYVDDRAVGGKRVELLPGRHVVQMVADGFETEQHEITIEAGSSIPLTFRNRRVIASRPDSALLILRLRAYADVFVDGELSQESTRRFEIALSPDLPHIIRLEWDDFEPFDTLVTLSPGDTVARTIRPRRSE